MRRKIGIVVISIAPPTLAADFCSRRSYAFACLADPAQRAYRAYGLGRGGFAEMFGPEVVLSGIEAAADGYVGGIPSGDPWQMAGVFLVDTSGTLRYVHRNRRADDHPRNAVLLAAADQLLQGVS